MNQGRPPQTPQYRPMGGAQRPPQGAPQRTPQRPPQRPPQGAPGRPPQRAPQRPSQGRPPQKPQNHGLIWGIVIGVVVLLLIVGVVIGCVLLIGGDKEKAPSRDDGGTKNPPKQTEPQETNPSSSIKAKFLSLPKTTSGTTYISSSDANVASMSEVYSAAAILVDLEHKTSIAEKAADEKVYPASMTKVMTLLLACERAKSATDLLTVTPEMLTDLVATGGASTLGGWQAGDQITVEDALFLINYKSDTIACWLIAEYIAGGEQEFAALMNQRATELGCTGTNFTNCTGLYDTNHYTTCRDMAAIMHAAWNNSAAKTVLSAYERYEVQVYRKEKPQRSQEIYAGWYSERLSDNAWAGGGSEMKFQGGKTGYEDIPTACFVTVAKNTVTGQEYICVTVGRTDASQAIVSSGVCTADAKYIYRRYAEGNTGLTR